MTFRVREELFPRTFCVFARRGCLSMSSINILVGGAQLRFGVGLAVFGLELDFILDASLSSQAFQLPRRSNHSSSRRKFAFWRLDINSFAEGKSFGVGNNDCRRYFLLDELDFRFSTFSFAERSKSVATVVRGNLEFGDDGDSLSAFHHGGLDLVIFFVFFLVASRKTKAHQLMYGGFEASTGGPRGTAAAAVTSDPPSLPPLGT